MCQFLARERVDDLHNLQLATKKEFVLSTLTYGGSLGYTGTQLIIWVCCLSVRALKRKVLVCIVCLIYSVFCLLQNGGFLFFFSFFLSCPFLKL